MYADVRPIEDAPDDVLSFGDISPDAIRDLCQQHVPGWSQLNRESFCIDQLCEGLSNQNFKVAQSATNSTGSTDFIMVFVLDVRAAIWVIM